MAARFSSPRAATLLLVAALCLGSAAAFAPLFSTGNPDGRIAVATRPDGVNGKFEIEAGDDFLAKAGQSVSKVTFTGLLPSGFSLASAQDSVVQLELYRVFSRDSDVSRCQDADPHTVCPTENVVTRANSPSDEAAPEFDRSTEDGTLFCEVFGANPSDNFNFLDNSVVDFYSANSVLPGGIHKKTELPTGGNGGVTGPVVTFVCDFAANHPWTFSADEHFFFVPKIALPLGTDNADRGDFLWLSAPKPLTNGFAFSPDLQSWTRDFTIDPDWVRIGTDVVGGSPAPTFNQVFALYPTGTPGPKFLAQGDFCAAGNPCFNAVGTRQVCCPGSCAPGTPPAGIPTCEGGASPVFP
ncbi:hypothetical protein KFL_000240120 [Klebsormidium nitens]|uniref:Uncharacterized protein n=1 Tax=Klebsormidium nitens TaxID=105231 RepID=A0A1Y1HMZ1_KLENI|nr:hypothetical protein KFL_000240120 [Klebsormidium nitens]|eukprot:GAQ79082.1 hypothetical protein KFL_000240120 [Klebsormidium nitens]